MPGVVAQDSTQHHHRSTTKISHKPYKPRFASKNAIRDRTKGRIESLEKGQRRTPHQHVMSKFDRKNQNKQRRMNRQNEIDRARNIFSGKDGAPRIVAVLPLCENVDPEAAIAQLNASLDIAKARSERSREFVHVDRFKQKIQYLPLKKDLSTALDACRVADYVICMVSALEEVDDYGELILRSIENQGVSNVYTAVAHLFQLNQSKKKTQTLTSLKSFITHFFAEQEKVFTLDSQQECQNLVRKLCSGIPKGVSWRQNRSWMYAEELKINGKASEVEDAEIVLTGVVRGRNLKADRLVRLNNLGDFKISRITEAPRALPTKATNESMTIDMTSQEGETLDQPSEDADTLDTLAPEEILMRDLDDLRSLALTERKSVLLDDEVLDNASEDEEQPTPRKRLPKGTSEYQAAWYLGDEDRYDSDFESDDDAQREGDVGMDTAPDLVEAGPSAGETMDAATTVAGDEPEEDGDLAAFRATKHAATSAESDRQFPDEIELPPSAVARERLAKYRGLKSARTSPWATEQDAPHEPADWGRLLDVANPSAVKNRVFNESLVGGVPAGRRVAVHLRVPAGVAAQLDAQRDSPLGAPTAIYSLLRHEHKHSAMHATLTIPRDFPRPLRNKERIVLQVGPRRFAVRALLSQPGVTPNNVHKMLRWAWPGDTVVVSWTGPVTWGAVPVVYFAPAEAPTATTDDGEGAMATDGAQTLLGSGTLLAPSTARILAKRAVLTGQPYALHKRQTHVRYMFFHAADVRYFAALPLWTTRGRRGTVKESLGTHGQFKAVFDGRVNPQEAVAVSLWKRVWPRPAVEVAAV